MGVPRIRPRGPRSGRIDTLLHWRRTITTPASSIRWSAWWATPPRLRTRTRPLAFCFIDGGHGEEPAWADFRGWSPHVALGGWLAIHDVFPDPADGGRPPYELFCAALESGEFVEDAACGSLRVLRRVAAAPADQLVAGRTRTSVPPRRRTPAGAALGGVTAVGLGQVERGRQAFAAEQAGRRRRVGQRVGGEHHGPERVRGALALGERLPSG